MKNRIQLHQLIHKLSKGEKRAFKLYVKKYDTKKDQKVVQLFDLLNKMPEHNEEKLLEVFSKKQLTYHLHKLKNILLDALSDFHFKNNDESIGEIINRIELGFKYENFDLIEDNIKQGYKLAEKKVDTAMLIHLLQYEQSLSMAQKNFKKDFETNKNLINITKKLELSLYYRKMWLELIKWFSENIHKEAPLPLVFSEPKIEELFNAPLDEQIDYKSQENYIIAKIRYYDTLQEIKQSLKYNKLLLNLYLNTPIVPLIPFNTIYNIVLYHLRLKEINEAEDALSDLDKLNHNSINKTSREDFYLFLSNLILMYKRDYVGIINMKSQIQILYEKIVISKNPDELHLKQLILGLVIALFKEQKFSECLDWIVKAKLLDKKPFKSKKNVYITLQIIELFVHIELGNTQILSSLFNSIQYLTKLTEDSNITAHRAEIIRIAKSVIKNEEFSINWEVSEDESIVSLHSIFFPYLEEKQKELKSKK